MKKIALFGVGKIGEAISTLLSRSGRYEVAACDALHEQVSLHLTGLANVTVYPLNLNDEQATLKLLTDKDAVISALPYFCNAQVASLARKAEIHYLDLSEDVATAQAVAKVAKGSKKAFIPQCGLAPGFVSIVAQHLVNSFDTVDTVKMRVGALPLYPSNCLKYNLTWSTDGLINEYGNPCEVLENGRRTFVRVLEGYERLSLDGAEYEAFNTSGGMGTLCETLAGKVRQLDYKSIRYPGHRDLIFFLMNDLKLNEDRETLKRIFERALPTTPQDKILILVEVQGYAEGKFIQRSYASTIYHNSLEGRHFGAIQLSTSAGVCAVLDLLLSDQLSISKGSPPKGIINCEQFPFEQIVANEFGRLLKPSN